MTGHFFFWRMCKYWSRIRQIFSLIPCGNKNSHTTYFFAGFVLLGACFVIFLENSGRRQMLILSPVDMSSMYLPLRQLPSRRRTFAFLIRHISTGTHVGSTHFFWWARYISCLFRQWKAGWPNFFGLKKNKNCKRRLFISRFRVYCAGSVIFLRTITISHTRKPYWLGFTYAGQM